jgi:hypothetical protein
MRVKYFLPFTGAVNASLFTGMSKKSQYRTGNQQVWQGLGFLFFYGIFGIFTKFLH